MSIRELLILQAGQLEQWAKVLKPEVAEELYRRIRAKTFVRAELDLNGEAFRSVGPIGLVDGVQIPRGVEIDEIVHNMKGEQWD